MVDKLFSQALDLVVGVEKHLPQLGHTQLKVGVVLEEIPDEMIDDWVPWLRFLECLGCGCTLETTRSRVELFLDPTLALHSSNNFSMSLTLLTGLFFHSLQLVLHVHNATLRLLATLSMRSSIFLGRSQFVVQVILLQFEEMYVALRIFGSQGSGFEFSDGLLG